MKVSDFRRNLIMSAAARSGLRSQREVADRSAIPRSTLYRRLENPGTLTVSELCLLDHRLKLTDEEIVNIVRGRETKGKSKN